MTDIKKFSIEIPVSLHTKFKTLASERQITLKDVLIILIENWIKDEEKRKEKEEK